MKPKPYIGINNDPNGAMNPTGNVIRDAWVFGLIPESETCEGWSMGQMDNLYDQRCAGLAALCKPAIKLAR